MKLKDLCTLGNLLSGFAAVIALFFDELTLACYLIYVAYIFDLLDGPIARLTKQFDTFGAHLDTICDYITNSVMVSLILFYAFYTRADYPVWLAGIISAFPLVFGTLRQAHGQDRPLSYPCYFLGLPRPVTALFLVSMMGSSLFHFSDPMMQTTGHLVSAGLTIVLSILHLSHFPFLSPKERNWFGMVQFGKNWFVFGTPVILVMAWIFGNSELFFDYLLASMACYVFLGWTQIPKGDFEKVKTYIKTGERVLPAVHSENTSLKKSKAPYFEGV